MSRHCQVTGRKPSFGKSVSHSHRRTSRRWDPNIQTKRVWLASEHRFVKIKLSVKGLRTLDRKGAEAVVREMRSRGARV